MRGNRKKAAAPGLYPAAGGILRIYLEGQVLLEKSFCFLCVGDSVPGETIAVESVVIESQAEGRVGAPLVGFGLHGGGAAEQSGVAVGICLDLGGLDLVELYALGLVLDGDEALIRDDILDLAAESIGMQEGAGKRISHDCKDYNDDARLDTRAVGCRQLLCRQ